MVSRRSFLTSSATVGALAYTGVGQCRPPASLEASIQSSGNFTGTSADFIQRRKQYLKDKDPNMFLGYPSDQSLPPEGYFKWRDELFNLEFGKRNGNNVGDPYEDPEAMRHVHFLETATINTFGARFGFDPQDTWGFISNSGTDSNMHGAYIGRTLLHQRTGVIPKIYYTKEAHYSIQIIKDLLVMEEILVDTNPDGSMDTSDLADKLKANKNNPALVVPTIGTTFKGAIDNIDEIQKELSGYTSFVHLDAALFGGYFQVSKFADDLKVLGPHGKRYDSIAISCHKFFGFPSIAGIFITHKNAFEEYRNYFAQVHDPDYVSHVPGTITCSRDTVNPALFYYYSTEESLVKQEKDASDMLVNTEYLYKEMKNHFPDLSPKRANEKSNIVYFDQVDTSIKRKWTLATIGDDTTKESLAHAVIMTHVSKSYLDVFLEDLEKYKTG
jgi:glutamate/tyrosine decarboxylase-like PLP-dependent enzyme